MAQQEKFYVTTPIYYVTAKPHLGTTYSTILADVLNRWHQLKGMRTFFLTGTDEHGQKVAEAAAAVGQEPQKFIDGLIPAYQETWKLYDIAYNHFIRTTDTEHVKTVQHAVKDLIKRGDVYKGEYSGWYCKPCETFVPEHNESTAPMCPECKRSTVRMSEPSYFFKLSKYQDKLLDFYHAHPDFIYPKERLAEVVSFVKGGLNDLSISRSSISWGIQFPGDPEQVIYVWVDALLNYVSAIGYTNPARQKEFQSWWPANIHVMAKEIVRFHAVHWPALLMALELELPQHLLVHGWLLIHQHKMSKSLGNAIDPIALYQRYGADAVRYYLVSRMAITQDGDFSIGDLQHTLNKDLAGELGNLLNRITTLTTKYDACTLEPRLAWSAQSEKLFEHARATIACVDAHMSTCNFHLAYAEVKKLTALTNAYVHERAPWKQVQTNRDEFIETLTATSALLYCLGILLSPVMPKKCTQLLSSLGASLPTGNAIENLVKNALDTRFSLTAGSPLFEKIEDAEQASKPVANQEIKNESGATEIEFADFAKVQLVAGTIAQAEEVEKSEKLLKLQVDFGPFGARQILAGIKEYYAPKDLLGKQAVFVLNLKPRTMVGLQSQGMLLIAKGHIVCPAALVPNGTQLR